MLKKLTMAVALLMGCLILSSCGLFTPKLYSIGVSVEDVKTEYEPRGYKFFSGEDIYEQPQIIGLSSNGLTVIQMVGPPENLYAVRITSKYDPPHHPILLRKMRDDMESIFKVVAPRWREGKDWFTTNILKFSRSGTRKTSYKEVHPQTIEVDVTLTVNLYKDGAHGVSFGALKGIAVPTDDGWDTSK